MTEMLVVSNQSSASSKSYKDLIAYKKSKQLVKEIYNLSNQFPKKDYALQGQIKKAVISVPANIAEGQQRFSDREFSRFLYIARASLAEVEVYLDLALELCYVNQQNLYKITEKTNEIGRLINGLINSLKTDS